MSDARGDSPAREPPSADCRPRATLATLQLRARLMALARAFFDARGYFEVDVPLLSADRVIDPHLQPFAVLPAESASARTDARYLQTSVEFGMKRLLAAGARQIYQLSHVFRADERGPRHNPEFTMLEWYATGTDHRDQMRLTEELVCALFAGASLTLSAPFQVSTYREIFEQHAGINPFTATSQDLVNVARQHELAVPESLPAADRDGWLNLLLAFVIEPELGRNRPEFVVDYPPSQAALAQIRPGGTPVAERFELYFRGIELCNGYHELTDAVELRRRIEVESVRRAEEGLPALPASSRLLEAMEAGLPPCSGNALGFDRVVWQISGLPELADVLPFDWERA
ncbi:MAG: EF-P lysine aminoacylase EpmA [Planctomycetaceae bacterium]